MKNVLIVNKFFYPDIGGVETVVKQHVEFLKEEANITVLCIHKQARLRTSVECIDDVKVFRCSSFGTFFSMPLSISFFYYYFSLTLKNDVLIHHAPFPLADIAGFFIPRRLIKKFFIFWHSDIFKQKILKKILNVFIRHSCVRADEIIVTSEPLSANSIDLLPFKNKIRIIPLSVNVNQITSNIPTDYINNKRFDFIFLGRLCYYKGIDILLDSIKILYNNGIIPDIIIVGDGELSGYISSYIEKYSLTNVMFINKHVSERQKYKFISESKVFLFPSVAPSEAFGITQLESMALSVPVINTNIKSGVPTVSLHNETGLTVEPMDSIELASAMKELFVNDELRDTLSRGAYLRVSHCYDDKIISNKIRETFL